LQEQNAGRPSRDCRLKVLLALANDIIQQHPLLLGTKLLCASLSPSNIGINARWVATLLASIARVNVTDNSVSCGGHWPTALLYQDPHQILPASPSRDNALGRICRAHSPHRCVCTSLHTKRSLVNHTMLPMKGRSTPHYAEYRDSLGSCRGKL
jgi:hypothetical protein